MIALALAACQVPASGPTVHPATKSAAPASASPAIGSSTAPSASPRPLNVAASLLKPPSGAYQTLTGTVLADPAWLKAKAAGGVLSNNGSSFGAPNGGSIISDNGAGVLVDGGGSLVAAASGNVIPDQAQGLSARRGGTAALAADGSLAAAGGIISNGGASIISNGGASIVSNNAAGLTGKVKYAVQQVAERPPTAGMLVSAVSLKTHEYLPLGTDADGKPVYAVYTNLKGEYQLFLPKAEEGNVLVVASPPNSQDPHLVLNAYTPVQATVPVPVDEDVAVATRAMRKVFVQHMANLLTNQPDDGQVNSLGAGSKAFDAQLGAVLHALSVVVGGRAKAVGVPTGPGAADVPEVRLLAQELTDAGLGFMDDGQLVTSKLFAPDWDGPQEPALKALGQSFQVIRGATGRYLDAHPAPQTLDVTIDGRLMVGASIPACSSTVAIRLDDPASLGTVIVDRFLAGQEAHGITNTRFSLEAIAVPAIAPGTGLTYNAANPNWYTQADGQHQSLAKRMNACISAILGVLTLTLAPPDWKPGDPPPPTVEAVLKHIEQFAASHKFSAVPVPTAGPTCAPDKAATTP
ncbi:MAG: hypothetical protein JWM80_4339 [Cyanobacteria bacterium RYN_339]|nr:hypothetical protein [Cyanobacteria bacterium RYN_339]